MKIKSLEVFALNIPFYADHVTRHMQRALTHSERVHVYRVELDNGAIGYGENQGGESGDINRVVGQNPFAIMQDDGIGFGIQMSLFDAVGKAVGVPVYQLLGTKVRDRCPISWWDIDMPPEDWVAEAKESVKRGYTSIKLKARPWRDIFAQVDAVGQVVPKDYKLDIDFNGFLRTADGAKPVLQELDKHPNVAYYESPYYLGTDIEGAGRLQEVIEKRIVEHFNEPCLHARCCGGFVVGGGATGTRRVGALCASFDKPFWLQMVGTGITAAYAMHIGGVLTHAQLPAITCHELWEHDLLKQRLEVVDGTIAVPEGPGLGIEVDEAALEHYRVAPETPIPTTLYKQKKRICRVHIPDGSGGEQIHDFTGEDVYYPAFSDGEYPGFVRGVWLEIIEQE
ncbi:MAG: mandelate racemase/muconate lactonizing enzyme family protein [Candidatus Poribacteria bacterium]|nr:mandelate racemase/muconate lactonizing enzyme family protein [Candidatus Poribacteria bacterium]